MIEWISLRSRTNSPRLHDGLECLKDVLLYCSRHSVIMSRREGLTCQLEVPIQTPVSACGFESGLDRSWQFCLIVDPNGAVESRDRG
jgi:hypothetical protein